VFTPPSPRVPSIKSRKLELVQDLSSEKRVPWEGRNANRESRTAQAPGREKIIFEKKVVIWFRGSVLPWDRSAAAKDTNLAARVGSVYFKPAAGPSQP
jgi:hypothetical protein